MHTLDFKVYILYYVDDVRDEIQTNKRTFDYFFKTFGEARKQKYPGYFAETKYRVAHSILKTHTLNNLNNHAQIYANSDAKHTDKLNFKTNFTSTMDNFVMTYIKTNNNRHMQSISDELYNTYNNMIKYPRDQLTFSFRTFLPDPTESIETYTTRIKTALENPASQPLTTLDTSSAPIQPENDDLVGIISNILPHVPDQGINEFSSFVYNASKATSPLSETGVKSLVSAIQEKTGTLYVTEYLRSAAGSVMKDRLEKFTTKLTSTTEQRIQSNTKDTTTNHVRAYLDYFKTAATPQSASVAMDIDEPHPSLSTRQESSMRTQHTRSSTMDVLFTGVLNATKFRDANRLDDLFLRVVNHVNRNDKLKHLKNIDIENSINNLLNKPFSKETTNELARYGCELFRLNYYKLGIQYNCSSVTAVQSGGGSVYIGVAFPQTTFPHDGVSNRIYIDVKFYMTAIVEEPKTISSELYGFSRGLVGGRTNDVISNWSTYKQGFADASLCALPVPVNEFQYQFPMIMRTYRFPSITERLSQNRRPGMPTINPKQYCSAAQMLYHWIGDNNFTRMAEYEADAGLWARSQIVLECERACTWLPYGQDDSRRMRLVDGTGPIGSGVFNIPAALNAYSGNELFPKNIEPQHIEPVM